MKMSRIFVVFISLVIASGCSTRPDVHIYARYIDDNQKIEIENKLEEAGFDTKSNELKFPTTINNSTIIYSPFIEPANAVDLLINNMESLNVKINSVEILASGNHWYKKNSLAVFIVPEDKNLDDTLMRRDLANVWLASGCDKDVSLTLLGDGKYILKGNDLENEDQLLLSGIWKYRQYPYIEIRPLKGESWYRYYEIYRTEKQDKISKIEMLTLKPLQSHQLVGDCNFEFGTRYF